MSKFFAGGVSDSDVSSSEEEDLYASSVEQEQSSSEDMSSSAESSGSDGEDEGSDEEAEEGQGRAQYMRNQFLKGQGSDSSDDEEEGGKVVKSAKDKTLDEVDSEAKSIESHRSAGELVAAASAFDRFVKVAERANRQYQIVPVSVVRTLTDLEKFVGEKPATKLNPSNSKALNTLRQRLKKVIPLYEARLASYRDDPDSYEPTTPSLSSLVGGARVSSPAVAEKQGSPMPAKPEDLSSKQDFTPETVFSTLLQIAEMRGKKNTDRQELVAILEKLLAVANTTYQKISVLLMLVPIRFDVSSGSGAMPLTAWNAIDADIRALYAVLEGQSEYIVTESAAEVEDIERGPVETPQGVKEIPGSVSALVERLDDEHARALQVIDPHTTEYIERLRDESRLSDLILRAQCHNERNSRTIGQRFPDSESLCRLLVRRLNHMYYKPPTAVAATEAEAWQRVPSSLNSEITPRPSSSDATVDTIRTITEICNVLYRQPNTVFRTRAMLSLVYHYALTDHYYKARDLLLMSHLQSTIHTAEPAIQVLFNRALVQVGLCAFRSGLVPEALQSLSEICSSSRIKELLGQGVAKFQGGYHGQQQQAAAAIDRSQLLPFHMHINLELIECVYLTASLLVEVPYLATVQSPSELRKRTLNRPFRRMLDYHDRQVFAGPSENSRDHVIQAAKALQTGDWQTAYKLLASIKIWSLLAQPERLLEMLRRKLQIEGLRTYLLTYASSYSSLSLDVLSSQFELDADTVRQVLTRMILQDDLAATLDATSKFLLFRPDADASKLQLLALALADKTSQLVERNERLAGDGHGSEQNTRRPQQRRARA